MSFASALAAAESQLGVKYIFGAEDPGTAFDCSGLVQYAFGQVGIKLPRTAAEQQAATQLIGASQAKPGDLVFYGSPAHHVGIYVGNGKFIESPHTGTVVKIANIGSGVTFGRVKGASSNIAAGQDLAVASAKNPGQYISYGYVSALADTVPDIKKTLDMAVANNWDPQHFTDQLMTTNWWKQNSDQAKKIIALAQADPAEYQAEFRKTQAHVQQLAGQMGVGLSAHQIKNLTTGALYEATDDATLQQQIAGIFRSVPTGMTGGTSVQLQNQIRQLAAQYGVPVTQGWINNEIAAALKQGNGIEAATASLQQQAASLYPTLAKEIGAGQTTQQLAQPYMAQMAQTLEIDPSNISLTDPTIQKALLGQLPSSTAPTSSASSGSSGAAKNLGAAATATTLYDFTNALRNDPRWEQTSNAKASAYSLVHQLGQTFGFAS